MDQALDSEGSCLNVIAAMKQPGRLMETYLFLPFLMSFLAFEFAPFTNLTFALLIAVTAMAMVVGEVSVRHFLIGATPHGIAVVKLKSFSRRPDKVVQEISWPVDITVESKFTTYKVTIDGVEYEAGGRTYPEWLKMIGSLEWTPAGGS